jgi:outer membrane autotransporter protein
MSVMTGFTGALMGRLDSARVEGVAGGSPGTTNVAALPNDGMMALGARQKPRPGPAAAPGGPSSPLVVYALGTYLGGSLDAAPMLAGYAYGAASGTVGVEYSASRYLILGLAAGFTAADADLTTNATMDADAIQAAAYLSYATREWFVDALAAYAAVDIGMARPVLGGLVRGNTDAGVFALAARGGYLFDFGKLRAGPIAGLAYLYGTVDGYTETGALATTVGEQTVESITGSAGLRFLAPFQAGGSLFVPYLNVTLEHQFGDGTQSLAVSFAGVSTPVSVPAFDARDFGKIEGGVTVELAPEASVSVNGSSTFARDDAKDFRIAAGVNYRF